MGDRQERQQEEEDEQQEEEPGRAEPAAQSAAEAAAAARGSITALTRGKGSSLQVGLHLLPRLAGVTSRRPAGSASRAAGRHPGTHSRASLLQDAINFDVLKNITAAFDQVRGVRAPAMAPLRR